MSIQRKTHRTSRTGKRIADRYLCDYGHWHPSFNHASKCHARHRAAERKAVVSDWDRRVAAAKEKGPGEDVSVDTTTAYVQELSHVQKHRDAVEERQIQTAKLQERCTVAAEKQAKALEEIASILLKSAVLR